MGMTKEEVLRALRNAKNAAQVNDWDTAIRAVYTALSEMEERRRKMQEGSKHLHVRIKREVGGYGVYMGGVPKYRGSSARDAAHIGWQLVKGRQGVMVSFPPELEELMEEEKRG